VAAMILTLMGASECCWLGACCKHIVDCGAMPPWASRGWMRVLRMGRRCKDTADWVAVQLWASHAWGLELRAGRCCKHNAKQADMHLQGQDCHGMAPWCDAMPVACTVCTSVCATWVTAADASQYVGTPSARCVTSQVLSAG
jgi:hypothetical protein